MKKMRLLLLLSLLLITGCNNVEEEDKSEYLAMKSNLLEDNEFEQTTDLVCDITISIDRINSEEISYRVIIDNPKENMNDIKAMVVHNYYVDDIFPTIGLFDDKESLVVGNDEIRGIELIGYIDTTKDIADLDLELKVWISYTTDTGEVKDIYYKTT